MIKENHPGSLVCCKIQNGARGEMLKKRRNRSGADEIALLYSAVEAMRVHLPDLGRRSLTLDEFYHLADHLEIMVEEDTDADAAEGICFLCGGKIVIFLDPTLTEPRKTFVA